MLKPCVQAVERASKTGAQVLGLCSLTTARVKYLTSQVFFVRSLITAFRQAWALKAQPDLLNSNLFLVYLYTLTTGTNTTNKLNKGFSL